MEKVTFFWFRRDLRLEDNAGLYQALKKSSTPVLSVFIFDDNILELLENKKDPRIGFIHDCISSLHQELNKLGSSILIKKGKPFDVWKELESKYNIQSIYTNRDYEPYALERDRTIQAYFEEKNIPFYSFKDHVIFEKDEIVKKDGLPYTVFTPYSKRWLQKLNSDFSTIKINGKKRNISYYLKSYPSLLYSKNFFQTKNLKLLTLHELGFEQSSIPIPRKSVAQKLIKSYDKTRNYPAINGTSKLGIHFRFGTISIREKAYKAFYLNVTFLNELIWRDFYSMILFHFPHVENAAFRKKYNFIEWRNNEEEFKKWCEGKTGYPIVDAGMRELNTTGYMHNRVRMITASFLTKHLLIDWRWGEAYFAERLLDFDLASNNGGWQWATGCGTDAAPYFRIFNPEAQQKKFDKDFKYIKKWVPEFGTDKYPLPMVEHKFARERCLDSYKKGLESFTS